MCLEFDCRFNHRWSPAEDYFSLSHVNCIHSRQRQYYTTVANLHRAACFETYFTNTSKLFSRMDFDVITSIPRELGGDGPLAQGLCRSL